MRLVRDIAVPTLSEGFPGVLRMLTHPFPKDMNLMRGVPTDRSKRWCYLRRSELIRWCWLDRSSCFD